MTLYNYVVVDFLNLFRTQAAQDSFLDELVVVLIVEAAKQNRVVLQELHHSFVVVVNDRVLLGDLVLEDEHPIVGVNLTVEDVTIIQ